MVFKAATFRGTEPQVETDHSTRAAMEAAVSKALATAGGIDASDIVVTATGGDIILDGTVGHADEVGRAAEIAQAVDGVMMVRNRIWVDAGEG
jgi:osmotically-inducible protein OsmY